jgi:dTDP-4-amino-4,6-dideoxygalactose transaminase
MSSKIIPFNRPYMTGKELSYISEAHSNSMLAGDGPFTRRCHEWLEKSTGCSKALLTHSCTAALEMAALLLDIQPGDEIIMPSYTFVSTANAFVLRGGIPVFVDIREDTLNLDEKLIETAISSKTRVIVPVHYAGVSCEMDPIMELAARRGFKVVEDAAQGIMASYKGRALGSIGHLGTYSFHETKNITSGEGGALLVNEPELSARAEIIREKGTDRSSFFRGEVDKYTWQEIGSSFLPGELIAAFLWAQLEEAKEIVRGRLKLWKYYHENLESLELSGKLRRPIVPDDCMHNAHMYYVLTESGKTRQTILEKFKSKKIHAISHYIPLHSTRAGMKYGRTHGDMSNTDDLSSRIIRLPLWMNLDKSSMDAVIDILKSI